MKPSLTLRTLLGFLWLACGVGLVHAAPLGTAFTYQGRLSQNGQPVNGSYDLRFGLYEVASGGSPVAGPLTAPALTLSNGLFTVLLDFGAVFTGKELWVEIATRPAGSATFTNLAPRQPLTATPSAHYAAAAGTATLANGVAAGVVTSTALAAGAVTADKIAPGAVSQLGASDGSPTNAVQVNANGWVGLGTNAPRAGLEVAGGASMLAPQVLFTRQDESGGYTNLARAFAIALSDNLLAVAGYGESGITVMDISNPLSPTCLSQFRDGDGSFTNLALGTDGGVLAMKTNLLVIASSSESAVTLVSLTNPASPVKLATLRDGEGGWNELNGALALALSGNLLAIGALNDSAVTLADISNPAAPVKRIELKDGLFGFTNLNGVIAVALSSNLLAIGAYFEAAVTLVNVSDPANPVKLAELRNGVDGYTGLAGVYGLAFSGQLLAIAALDASAVTLVNVADPAHPVRLAQWRDGEGGVDGLSGALSVAFGGNWLAVSAVSDNAVTLFDLTDLANPRLAAVLRDGVAGFSLLNRPRQLRFAGTNLLVAADGDSALTLVGLDSATVSLVSQQRVGIGTALPLAPLHVVGNVVVEGANFLDLNASRVELGSGIASGSYATAMGSGTTASGSSSTAMGSSSTASGSSSTAMGFSSIASGNSSTAMGASTIATGSYSTAMGYATIAGGSYSTAMGYITAASGPYSTAMGCSSTAGGYYSTAMGRSTVATNYAWAAGRRAKATNDGAFVWADSTDTDVGSTNNNSVTFRAAGGYRLYSNSGLSAGTFLAPGTTAWAILCDRAAKKNFRPADSRAVLDKLVGLELCRWNYVWEADEAPAHLGPVAQEFKATFYPGRDERTITTLEFDGVALAAIQGLNQKVEEGSRRAEARSEKLEAENTALKQEVAELKARVKALAEKMNGAAQ